MTLFDMTGKVAVITGSSRGIGRAIAERMAEHGAKVVISSRKQQACDEVAKAINDKMGKQVALSVTANISTKDDLKHLRQQHRCQPLADLAGGAADDRAQGRLDHYRVLDRRTKGLDRARRLRDLESRGHAARAKSGLRIRQAQYSGQLHRARPDQDRLRAGFVGKS